MDSWPVSLIEQSSPVPLILVSTTLPLDFALKYSRHTPRRYVLVVLAHVFSSLGCQVMRSLARPISYMGMYFRPQLSDVIFGQILLAFRPNVPAELSFYVVGFSKWQSSAHRFMKLRAKRGAKALRHVGNARALSGSEFKEPYH